MVGASFTVAAVAQILRSKKGITAVGNAQIDTAQSKFGGASALFDGNGDYLAIANNPLIVSESEDFTIEAWVRPNATELQGYNWIVTANGPFVGFLFGTLGTFGVSTRTNFSINAVTIFDQAHPSAMATGTWYHIAVTRQSGSCKCWFNGTQIGSTVSNSAAITFTGPTTIGANSNNTSTPVQFWNGWQDEIRISNSARYTANFTPSTTPFVNDANTLLLIHADGTDASTFFEDEIGRAHV